MDWFSSITQFTKTVTSKEPRSGSTTKPRVAAHAAHPGYTVPTPVHPEGVPQAGCCWEPCDGCPTRLTVGYSGLGACRPVDGARLDRYGLLSQVPGVAPAATRLS